MPPLTSPDANTKALESRIAALEKTLQVSSGKLILQVGMAKITISNNDITLDTTGTITIQANAAMVQTGTNLQITSGGTTTMTAGGNSQIKAGGNIIMKATQILQN